MDRYDVLSPIKVKGKRIPAGRSLAIDDDQAKALLAYGVIAPASGDLPEADVPEAGSDFDNLVAAIGLLDKDDPSLWMKDGRPKTEALTVVGAVTAAERDAAWEAYKAKAAQQ